MNVVEMEPDHLTALTLQPAQIAMSDDLLRPEYRRELARYESYTALDDGKVLGCGGIVPWGHRAVAWTLIGQVSKRQFALAHRVVVNFLSLCEHRRIEAWVDEGFEPGVLWVEKLGFEREGLMKAFRPDGNSWLYARTR